MTARVAPKAHALRSCSGPSGAATTLAGLLALLGRIFRAALKSVVPCSKLWTTARFVNRTDRRKAEPALAAKAVEAEADQDRFRVQRLAAIVEHSDDAIMGKTPEGIITFWNAGAEKMFGFTAAEAIGRSMMIIVPPELAMEESEFLARVVRGESVRGYETRRCRKDGRQIDVSVTVSPVRDTDGRIVGASKVARDITERKHALDALNVAARQIEDNQRRLKNILDEVPVGIVLVDRARRIRWVNAHAARLAGIEAPAHLEGESCCEFLCAVPNGKCPVLDLGESIDRSQRRLKCRDGRTIPILKSIAELTIGGESLLLESFVDLSKQERLETELGHARKLEAVGQLAAGIAHEINTPAQFLGDSLQFVKEAFDEVLALMERYRGCVMELARDGPREDVLQALREWEEAADIHYLREHVPGSFARCFEGLSRVTSIVRAMKEFAHPDQREKSPADINQALRATLTIARNEYKYVADVETEFSELPPVACHIGDLNQVFLNLLVNAAHAIGDAVTGSERRGAIRVRTALEGANVRIEIEDTGSGIPAAVRSRIFEPFFTTKEVGKGTGQGLAIARSIVVDKHKGSLTFETVEGKGTTFTIRIPIGAAECARQEVSA
jgi:two-component system NtrC family sensor kinase